MRRLAALLLAALLFLLAACAAGGTPKPDQEPDWEDYQQGIPEEPEQEPEPEKPDYPETFSMAYYHGGTLDPITCGEGIQQDVAALLFEPLFQLNGRFEPEPLLCESYAWDNSGLVCTLTLRNDATFWDGSALSARDVVETLQRAALSERYAYRLRNVASVSADRSGQVVITLSAPDRGFPALLDIPIVKRGTGDFLVPTGTGPYCLVNGEESSYLQANETWWQGLSLPVSTIPLVHAKDRETAMYLFSTRKVGFLTVDPTDDPASVTGQAEMTDRPTTILQYIGFNTAEGRPFADRALRAAFSVGIPRETMADVQLADLALPAQFPISPLSELYPDDLETVYSKEAALEALRAAGQDTGKSQDLTLLVNEEDGFRLTTARYIAQSLTLLDWHITVRALPWEEYLLALQTGEFDLYFGEVRLTANWDLTDLIGTEGALNYGGYSDSFTDTLLRDCAAAEDRQAAVRRLMIRLRGEMPIAAVCFKNYKVLTHTGVVEGLSPTASTSFYGLQGWQVHTKP